MDTSAANNQSEVARLLARIEDEYIAAKRGMTGFAESATHAAITAQMENIGRLYENLHAIIGDEAIKLVAERLEIISTEQRGKACIAYFAAIVCMMATRKALSAEIANKV